MFPIATGTPELMTRIMPGRATRNAGQLTGENRLTRTFHCTVWQLESQVIAGYRSTGLPPRCESPGHDLLADGRGMQVWEWLE